MILEGVKDKTSCVDVCREAAAIGLVLPTAPLLLVISVRVTPTLTFGWKGWDESDGKAGVVKRRVMKKIVCSKEVNSEVLIYQ